MTLRLFEGPAGSGKTTRLFEAVGEYLQFRPLDPDQRVLALTKMHGARRRMQGKLVDVLGTTATSECATLNSFTHGLVHRWRTLARTIIDPLPEGTEFVAIAEVASRLLERDSVVRWVAARYPLLVVDELQDLRGPELAVIKGLARGLDVLSAADEFQDLDPQATCEGVEWARAEGAVVTLNQVHRTNVPALLAAACSVRARTPPTQGTGFKVFPSPNTDVAASFLARNLTWARGSEVAVLSPAGPEKSKFVHATLERLARRPFEKDGKSFGPFAVPWEASPSDEMKAWSNLLALDDDARILTAKEILAREEDLPGPLVEWVRTRGRLAGEVAFSARQVREQLGRAHSLLRAHGSHRRLSRIALTVHQAKNREFEHVIVLWPVTLGGGAEVQRRLLYNAITRAKRDCLVLVQDPKPKASRLHRPPFA